jgi:hypothetical protein
VKEIDAAGDLGHPVGAEGVVMLPFFNGERVPEPAQGEGQHHGSERHQLFTRENIARASLESAIFGMKIGLDRFRELGFDVKADPHDRRRRQEPDLAADGGRCPGRAGSGTRNRPRRRRWEELCRRSGCSKGEGPGQALGHHRRLMSSIDRECFVRTGRRP